MKVFDFDNTIYNGESIFDFALFVIWRKKSLLRYFPIGLKMLFFYKTRKFTVESYTKELEKAWQFDLKIFTDTNYNNIETITLNLPKKWEEIASSKGSNIYQTREFGLDYLKDLDYHQYSIVYSYSRNYYDDFDKGLSSKVEIVNNSISTYSKYGKHEKVIFRRKINLHKKTFYYYSGGYTDVSGKYVEIHLLYVKTNSGILEVKIYGNDVKVSESLFEEITDFDIKLEE